MSADDGRAIRRRGGGWSGSWGQHRPPAAQGPVRRTPSFGKGAPGAPTIVGVANLLVVEDDEAIAEPLVRALVREGHEVAHAATRRGGARDGGGLALPSSSCSTSACPASTAIEVCRRLSERPPAARDPDAHGAQLGARRGRSASTPEPTTTSPSRSRSPCWRRGCVRCCGAPTGRRRRGGRRARGPGGAAGMARPASELELSPKEFDLLALLVAARRRGGAPRGDHGPRSGTRTGGARRRRSTPTSAGCGASSATRALITTVRGVGFRFER